MTIQTKSYLCGVFSNGCVPTQQNFYDLIDSSDGVYQCLTTCAMVPKYTKGITRNASGTQAIDLQVVSDATQVACTACSTIVGGAYNKICTSSTGATFGGIFSAMCSCVCSTSTQKRQVIFGGCCNILNDSTGAFIAGGSNNRTAGATGNPHYIIGGCANLVSSARGLISGGACNTNGTSCSVMFGGYGNYSSTTRNVAMFGGCSNVVIGTNISGLRVGGYFNCGGNTHGAFVMGCCNCGTSATLLGCGMSFGGCNTIQESAFIMGVCNFGRGILLISPNFVFGCRNCTSSGNSGQFVWGSSSFTTAQGEVMAGFLHLRRQTTDATATYLTTTNSVSTTGNRFFIDSGTAYSVTAIVTAYRTGGIAAGNVGDSGVWIIHGVVKNVSGTTTLVGQSTDYSYTEDVGWAVTLVGNNTNDALEVQVTGVISENINWTARIDFVKVKA